MPADKSHGYEAVAVQFLEARARGAVGIRVVREWARTLPRGASVLDLGCGSGFPVSNALVQEGCIVAGVDASATMIDAFKRNFQGARTELAAVEEATFLNTEYDAVVAWGLLFLLEEPVQEALLRRVAGALKHGGQFFFTAPAAICTWTDVLTGLRSVSLGREQYRAILHAAGFALAGERDDEGENHYYLAVKL